jgi:hypothetical protein
MQPGSEKPVRRHSGPQAKAAEATAPHAAQSLLDLSRGPGGPFLPQGGRRRLP